MARGRPSRATVYARLESAIAELNERLGGLPSPKESEYVWSDIWHLEARHSTALERNTLVLREVEALLDKGRAVGATPSRCASTWRSRGTGFPRAVHGLRYQVHRHPEPAGPAPAAPGPASA